MDFPYLFNNFLFLSTDIFPFITTYSIPSGAVIGFSKVALSATLSLSNIVISASAPINIAPLFFNDKAS